MKPNSTYLRQSIRTIADYPKPGIQFRDITTLLRDAKAFEITVDALIEPWRDQQDRQGRGHRSARLHSRRRRGARPQVRFRADSQARQAAARNRARGLLARIRRRRNGNAHGRHPRRRERVAARRPHRHRRHRDRAPRAAAVGGRAGCAPPASSSIFRGSAALRACAPPASRCSRCSRSEPAP